MWKKRRKTKIERKVYPSQQLLYKTHVHFDRNKFYCVAQKIKNSNSKANYIRKLILFDIENDIISNLDLDKALEYCKQHESKRSYIYKKPYQFLFKFREDKFPQIVEKLNSVSSKSIYIRNLVLLDCCYDILSVLNDIDKEV